MKKVDPYARQLRKNAEDNIESVVDKNSEAIAKARFAIYGTSTYPDATFTLRLSYGTVKGYKEDGKDVPAYTTMAGMFERSKEQNNRGPFELPKRSEAISRAERATSGASRSPSPRAAGERDRRAAAG